MYADSPGRGVPMPGLRTHLASSLWRASDPLCEMYVALLGSRVAQAWSPTPSSRLRWREWPGGALRGGCAGRALPPNGNSTVTGCAALPQRQVETQEEGVTRKRIDEPYDPGYAELHAHLPPRSPRPTGWASSCYLPTPESLDELSGRFLGSLRCSSGVSPSSSAVCAGGCGFRWA